MYGKVMDYGFIRQNNGSIADLDVVDRGWIRTDSLRTE
jgi:hypothetical protein